MERLKKIVIAVDFERLSGLKTEGGGWRVVDEMNTLWFYPLYMTVVCGWRRDVAAAAAACVGWTRGLST